jgi:hypothetical protein
MEGLAIYSKNFELMSSIPVASGEEVFYIFLHFVRQNTLTFGAPNRMKRISPAFLLIMAFSQLMAQAPTVQLLLKQKSGFLGMGGPRYIELELSNKDRQPITSKNVNEGNYYYFICRPVGEWKIEADFLKEDLPKLSLYQSEKKYPVAWFEEIGKDVKASSLLIGFPKDLRLHQLFLVQVIGDTPSQVEMKVPQEYWPGYDAFMDLMKTADNLYSQQNLKEAIATYDKILKNEAFQIFPDFPSAKEKRLRCFDQFFSINLETYNRSLGSAERPVRDKIADLDRLKPAFRFVVDSLPNAALNVTVMEPSVKSLVDRSSDALSRMTLARDSLQRVLDDQNIRWIVEGSTTGRTGYMYRDMIEVLAYAFSSMNFKDTTTRTLKLTISAEHREKLVKNNLMESYETFIRVCNERFQNNLPIFPIDFLPNLRKDTASFPLPFYSVLRAVNDYWYGSYATARQEIFTVFRHSYDTELSGRLDQMRMMIDMKTKGAPFEAFDLIREAEEAEAKGNRELASQRYLQATDLFPNFAYAFFVLGKFYLRSGDPIRARTFIQRAYQLDTLFLSAYREAYSIDRRGGNYKPMIDVLTSALQKGNDYWEIHFNLGTAYMGDLDPARAIQHFERAIALNPKSYITQVQLGLAWQTMKNYQRAREYFMNAINIDPQKQEAVDFLNRLNELQRTAK